MIVLNKQENIYKEIDLKFYLYWYKMLELNSTIVNKLRNMNFETLEDLDIIEEKTKSIRQVWSNSDRLKPYYCYYSVEYLSESG
jgi:hypothetical protein